MVFQRLLEVFRPMIILQATAPAKDPDFIDKYKKLSKKAGRFLDTFAIDHKEAYLKAADKHLRDKEGLIDYEKLDDEGTRGKFADDLAQVYFEKASKYLKSSAKPDDAFAKEMIMNAVYGQTLTDFKREIAKHRKEYTADQHEKLSDQYMENIKGKIAQLPMAHISEEHIDDIIKYTKADAAAASFGYDLNKSAFTRAQAAQLLGNYVALGSLPKGILEKIGPPYFHKKKK